MGLLGTTWPVFIGLTLILVGGAAVMTGHAVAENWKPAWHVVLGCIGLGLANRFLHYALFGERLLHLPGFVVETAILIGLGLVAHRMTLAHKMVVQYPWKYERAGPFGWSARSGA